MTGKFLPREAPNVVTTRQFHSLLREGYQAEVVCAENAYKKASFWYGAWYVRVVNPERTFEKVVSSTRIPDTPSAQVRVRLHKTANGLISFLADAGFTHPTIPLKEGGRQILTLPPEESPTFGAD